MAFTSPNQDQKGGAGQMMFLIRWYGLLIFLIASVIVMVIACITTLF